MNNTNYASGYVAVAGGVNVDIGGTAVSKLVTKDSNPGMIHISMGGVGRNIAHNMRLLGLNVKMLTAIGDDHNAELIKASCDGIGIDLSESLFVEGAASSTYMFINQPDGDMEIAVNDMRICEELTPAYYASKMDVINQARLLIIDANLPAESIHYLVENAKVPVFADMVSTIKGVNFVPVLDKIHTIKANKIEAEMLSGMSINDDRSLMLAAIAIREKGVKNVFISLGADGMYVAFENECTKVPPVKAKVWNTTGAGDSSMAALAWCFINGIDPKSAARYANAAASITIESFDTISADMSVENIIKRLD